MTIKKEAIILLPAAARKSTPGAITLCNNGNGLTITGIKGAIRGQLTNLHVIVDVTAIASNPIIQTAIKGLDPASGKFYELITGIPQINFIGTTIYRLGRDIETETIYRLERHETEYLCKQDCIPDTVRISFNHENCSVINYSVGINCEVEI